MWVKHKEHKEEEEKNTIFVIVGFHCNTVFFKIIYFYIMFLVCICLYTGSLCIRHHLYQRQ